MRIYFKKAVALVVVLIVLMTNIPTAGSSPFFAYESNELSMLLHDGLFYSFLPDSFLAFDETFGMCGGALLLECKLTSGFGWRRHPIRRRPEFHSGIDLKAERGAPIIAPADGYIKDVGRARGYGKFVEMDHGFAWGTKYAHLSRIYVKEGQFVKKGEVIGAVGRTGAATGSHLHFEVSYFGVVVNPSIYFALLNHVGDSRFASR